MRQAVCCAILLSFLLAASGCDAPAGTGDAQRVADREAIEQVRARANLGFNISDPDLFAGALAPAAVYELAGAGTAMRRGDCAGSSAS